MKIRIACVVVWAHLTLVSIGLADAHPDKPVIQLNTSSTPPEWALWQRHVMESMYPAAREFVAKYTRPDGSLIWRDEWPGMDGSDDGYESFYNFPLYYVLGGPADLDPLSRNLWEAVTIQFTEYGQIADEFDAGYDWMHHGESYTYFYFFGLADPKNERFRDLSIKFAGMYLGSSDPQSNYDPELKLMRSPLTGSLGPRFVNTAEDWVTHRPIMAKYPLPFDDIPNVTKSEDWNDDRKFQYILEAINTRMMRGDIPLNLTSTGLMANAYMYTGDEKYKTWILDYVDAWIKRVEDNDGFIPDNIGLSGKVGEYLNGKVWGGYYGWKWPHGLFSFIEPTLNAGANATLVSGDPSYHRLPQSVFDLVRQQSREEDGQILFPHRYDDRGWYDFRTFRTKFLAQKWFQSRSDDDWQFSKRIIGEEDWTSISYNKGKGDSENSEAWLGFLEGVNPSYPVDILKATLAESQRRLALIRADQTTPDEQDVHHWLKLNPVVLEGLVQLTLGAPNHIYHGGLLHTSVRYFDPENKRPGLPSDVAVLVDKIHDSGISLQLVNLHASEPRRLTIQGGAFAEHQITSVRQVIEYPYQFHTINDRSFEVNLGPGTVARLEIDMQRHANQPTYDFPWH